ncbi:unnamed protein product [Phytomonas sp. EM1]|nr:unnamed protein product [Phytomonas sp. EM1]|eukprot:CCW61454.1 unnamed protein product [Phytomonas sp. isolate EM1]
MQIEADAQHLYNFRDYNKIEGVCYVCHEVDCSVYEALMEEQHRPTPQSIELGFRSDTSESSPHPSSTTFFNQYLIDELGMVKDINVDGRSDDGS